MKTGLKEKGFYAMRSYITRIASSVLITLASSFPLFAHAQFGSYNSFGGYPGPNYGSGNGYGNPAYNSYQNYNTGNRRRNNAVFPNQQSGNPNLPSGYPNDYSYGQAPTYNPSPNGNENPQQALQQYNQQAQQQANQAQNDSDADSEKLDQYANFSEAGSRFYRSGQLNNAIEEFEKARLIAPDNYVPVVYNNLAAAYIRRGNYYLNDKKQATVALNDFRKAYYYLEPGWPEGEGRNATHNQNRTIAKTNLFIAYKNMSMGVPTKAEHLEMASGLRTQANHFAEAITEASLAYDMDRKDTAVAKTLGDLFTVINQPEKSKKYYALVAGGSDAAAAAGLPGQSKDDLLVQLGTAQYKTGEIDKAIANLNKALATNPNNEGAMNVLLKIWKSELQTNPTSVTAHANLGSLYQKKRDYNEALKQYNAAEHFADSDPRTPFDIKKQIRLNIGTLFQSQKRYDLALKAYDTVLQVDPKNQTAMYYKATLLGDTGKIPEAIDAYNRLLAIDPKNGEAQDKILALIKQQKDQPQQKNENLQAYANRFPTNATVQAQVGEEFHQQKDLMNAEVYYKKALAIDPKLASVWANLGAVYQAENKVAESKEAYEKAQAIDPKNASYKQLAKGITDEQAQEAYTQAVAIQQKGKPEESLELYRKSLALQNKNEVRFDYGIALQSSGKLDDALSEYKKVALADPKNADVLYAIGTVYQQKKDFKQAEASYKSALAVKPGYADAVKALSDLKLTEASGQLDEAIKAYTNKQYPIALTKLDAAIARNPQEAMAYYYKGLIYDAQKKVAFAITNYRNATRYNPSFSDAYYALAVDLDTQKDTSGAKAAFSKFVQLSGDKTEDDFVKYAKERLKTLGGST